MVFFVREQGMTPGVALLPSALQPDFTFFYISFSTKKGHRMQWDPNGHPLNACHNNSYFELYISPG